MIKCINYMTLLLLFMQLYFSNGQNGRPCPASTVCKPLIDCPELISLIRSGDFQALRKVREAICGFQGRNSLVCCNNGLPSFVSPTTPFVIETSPRPGPSGENLLPRQCGSQFTPDRIFGGSPAPIGAYPWMVAIAYSEIGIRGTRFLCGGSLINNRYVLTAAHCLNQNELGNKRVAKVHIGDWDLSKDVDCQHFERGSRCAPPPTIAGVEDIIIHPEYDSRARASDDIGLIRLNITIEPTSHIKYICMPKVNFNVRSLGEQRTPIAAGWGMTEKGDSDILLRVYLPFANDTVCNKEYPGRFVSKQLCVGGDGGRDTCSGDSGAPLFISEEGGPPFFQLGIVSYGSLPCAIKSRPAVYTSVSDYRDWIVNNLKP